MTIRAQNATFLDLRDQVRASAQVRDYCHLTTFVAQMVEIEHNWIGFPTQNARMLAQIVVDKCSIPVTASLSTANTFDPLIVGRASFRQHGQDEFSQSKELGPAEITCSTFAMAISAYDVTLRDFL
jgi:hypothetical protein